MQRPLLELDDVSVAFRTERGRREVLSSVGFTVGAGEIVGVVGESGSGKSVTALAIMRLLGAQGEITSGRIRLDDQDLAALSETEMLRVRGRLIAMIFQEPMTSLNPLLKIGFQISEVLREHLRLSAAEARSRAVALLDSVGIPGAASRYDDYPHLLSGGMRQRVMIAMAMACKPRLLIADEPTTALDVTIQAQILELMLALRAERGSAVLLITHDMGVIARMADRVVVMYAGEVAEVAPLRQLFERPAHPYTRLLMAATPTARHKAASLPVIPGAMPSPEAMPGGCRFHPRCPDVIGICRERPVALRNVGPGRTARCWRAEDMLQERVA